MVIIILYDQSPRKQVRKIAGGTRTVGSVSVNRVRLPSHFDGLREAVETWHARERSDRPGHLGVRDARDCGTQLLLNVGGVMALRPADRGRRGRKAVRIAYPLMADEGECAHVRPGEVEVADRMIREYEKLRRGMSTWCWSRASGLGRGGERARRPGRKGSPERKAGAGERQGQRRTP